MGARPLNDLPFHLTLTGCLSSHPEPKPDGGVRITIGGRYPRLAQRASYHQPILIPEHLTKHMMHLQQGAPLMVKAGIAQAKRGTHWMTEFVAHEIEPVRTPHLETRSFRGGPVLENAKNQATLQARLFDFPRRMERDRVLLKLYLGQKRPGEGEAAFLTAYAHATSLNDLRLTRGSRVEVEGPVRTTIKRRHNQTHTVAMLYVTSISPTQDTPR